jgi:allantoicase
MKEFTHLVDLASERLGGRVIDANDDFFGPKEYLLRESKPVFIDGKYTSRGKWMDGWETRRRRTPGHDWCIVRLGLPGIIHGIVVDTSFFKGNYPAHFSLEGCSLGATDSHKEEKGRLRSAKVNWVPIFPESALKGDSQNLFPAENGSRFTHLRLKIYPDGGVARLRVHGQPIPDVKKISRGEVDLVAVQNGGSVVVSSDEFFGAPLNLLMPYRAQNMKDGWESRRRRGPGHDWVVLKLGVPGTIRRIEVDTTHYKGNFPDSCSLEACRTANGFLDASNAETLDWKEVLPQTKLKANYRHVFSKLWPSIVVTHLRFQIYPDGGVSRLRVFGLPEKVVNAAPGLDRLHRLPRKRAVQAFLDCCGAIQWAKRMTELRPFASESQLFEAADRTWAELQREDWLEAFRHHPAIGGKRAEAKRSPTQSRWSSKEQSAARAAPQKVLQELAAANKAYAEKFGYVFLICATGRISEEILKALRQRMPNDPETELRIAEVEQRKIMRLRLEKLLNS